MLTRPILFVALTVAFGLKNASWAQYPGVQGTVERQIQLLEQKKQYAAGQIATADEALAGRDYEKAYAHFKSAVDVLPIGGAATIDVREQALDGFCDAAVKLASQRVSEGRYVDARTIVEVILEEPYDPNYSPALALRSKLLDQIGFADRGTLTPGYIAKVEVVKQMIKEGENFFATGRFDLAFKRCEQALNVDKYNIAARKLMERINGARQIYADAAYNETRSDMLMQVQKAWELPVRKFTDGPTAIIEQPEIPLQGSDARAINLKLDEIIIPKLDFTDASIVEAIDFLRKRAEELDETESDGKQKGVNIVLNIEQDAQDSSYPITLSLESVPLRAALEYVARAANLKTDVEAHAIVISSTLKQKLVSREYKVPPGFFQGAKAKAYLEDNGIDFPEGASATFSVSSGRMRVINTLPNLDNVDMLVEGQTATKTTQIEIEARFLEISQNNLDELGFDWLLGQFALAGGSGVYGSGGTQGFGRSPSPNQINPVTGVVDASINDGFPLNLNGFPIGSSSEGGPVTAGNRAGAGGNGYETAISLNAVDALLLNTPAGAPAGVLSVAGVFTNPQFQVVLRALSQKKGVDLISSPKVTAKSGEQARIEIIRDFRYPTEFEPPQLSATNGSIYTPIVPSTPTGWETKPTGITLEVQPNLAADNYTIEMELVPRIVEFEGFINYGSPINATVARQTQDTILDVVTTPDIISTVSSTVMGYGPSYTFTATPNTINMPVFSTREVSTLVSVYDGQTVVLGGLMREDVQKVQDKVPILGDIPLAGRLFRSNVDQHIKRNLVMFVTASLMDPAGQPIIKAEEEDAIVPEPGVAEMIEESIPGDVLSAPLPQ